MFSRRSLIVAGVGAALASRGSAHAKDDNKTGALNDLAALEAKRGGRLGVSVFDAGTSRRLDYRADERFAMCSTHKFLTVAAILQQVDRGEMSFDRKVSFTRADLLAYAPITRQHVAAGVMTVDALAAAPPHGATTRRPTSCLLFWAVRRDGSAMPGRWVTAFPVSTGSSRH